MATPETKTEARTIAAHCHCKSTRYTVTLPASILPISAHMCHCARCRYTHGTLCIFHAPLPTGVHPNFSGSATTTPTTTRYFRDGFLGDRRFCTTCGCHVGDYVESLDMWYIATAPFPKDETVFLIDEHLYTRSAPAGLYDWLPSIGPARKLRITNPEDGSAEPEIPEAEFGAVDGEDRLRCECHCGGVSFTIRRPPPLAVTTTAGDGAGGDGNEDEVAVAVRECASPVHPRRWKAVVDACNDCRLVNGVHVGAWAYVPLAMCEPGIGPDLQIGTSKTYASSPGTLRSFCGVCGATVFYYHPRHRLEEHGAEGEGKRHDGVVRISVGVFRAPEGVRADSWLTWRTSEISGLRAGCAYDREYFESLNEGVRNWGVQQYSELVDFSIPY
ncbi:hypothetical protein SLS62_010277 [Diatrype stigma]|uniref:CENP-V/GFA domain-containing protein n=1 Tax=Diatrype stigma TaxID=117547 RepID=A0AAN9YIM0_9PEZI